MLRTTFSWSKSRDAVHTYHTDLLLQWDSGGPEHYAKPWTTSTREPLHVPTGGRTSLSTQMRPYQWPLHTVPAKMLHSHASPKPIPPYPPSVNKSQEAVLLLANPTRLPAELESPGNQGYWHCKAVMTLCSDIRWRTAWPRHGRQYQRHLGATLRLADSKCQILLWIFKMPKGTAVQKGLLGYIFQTAAHWVSPP